jgi:vacuolar protein sorting-associated protein VTA1
MPLTIPPELKKITPFVRRAEELDKDSGNPESRLVAYYCRQYAVHTGIEAATSAAGKGVLGELLGSLEKEKEAMNSFTRDEAKFLCRKFADKIFDKADLEDRTGDANKNTAKTFYAAASFLEILQQFYKDDDGSEEREEEKKRAVYSKWKATEILKAIKEGRQHTPGGYGEDEEEEEPEVTEEAQHTPHDPSMEVEVETVVDNDDEEEEEEPSTLRIPAMEEDEEEPVEAGTEVELPPPSYPGEAPSSTIQPPPPAPVVYRPPVTFDLPPVPPPMSMPAPPTAKPQPPPEPTKPAGFFGLGKKKKLSKAEIADATELTRFALAALEDKNIDVAGDRLKQALHALGR